MCSCMNVARVCLCELLSQTVIKVDRSHSGEGHSLAGRGQPGSLVICCPNLWCRRRRFREVVAGTIKVARFLCTIIIIGSLKEFGGVF